MDAKEYEFEVQHLQDVEEKLESEHKLIVDKLEGQKEGVDSMVKHISDSFYTMDAEEKVQVSMLMESEDVALIELLNRDMILKKQISSPYFGRIDFKGDDERFAHQYYIGIANLSDEKNAVPYICDWRAPVSSMYYDFETGRATYEAPIGQIDGDIDLKRQYKIKDKKLEFCFDSNLTIGDEILQETLSGSTDLKMKNIVSTIQKEQNQIIRSDIQKTLVVQGVAGSGKTSIALHRIAFLLYRYKDTIKARNILIVSPNKIFSDYISNVLPELGEQNVDEITFSELARDELRDVAIFEERTDMLEDVLKGNEKRAVEIGEKSSFAFFEKLVAYLQKDFDLTFEPEDIVVGEDKVEKEKIAELFSKRYQGKDVSTKIEWIAEYVVDQFEIKAKEPIGMINRIKNRLYKFFKSNKILKIYEDFLSSINMPITFAKSGRLKHEDVAPLLYVKNFILGIQTFKNVKYVLIDEMQDYSPLHFNLFNKMFKCPKTVLGDIYQCFEKSLGNDYLENLAGLWGEDGMLLNIKKAYRSTVEIAKFAQKIIGLENVENVDRHGYEPKTQECQNEKEMVDEIIEELQNLAHKNYSRVALLCKTDNEAKGLYELMKNSVPIELLTKDNTQVVMGNIVTTSALSKGLEFDAVIIPYAGENNYSSKIDKNVLYISCTRALHELELFSIGKMSQLIKR